MLRPAARSYVQASMWPRSRERGNLTTVSPTGGKMQNLLQCGRAHVSAETAVASAVAVQTGRLQCGRAHVSAETATRMGCGCTADVEASMWPRSRERGNSHFAAVSIDATIELQCGRAHVSAETCCSQHADRPQLAAASMWPRSRERGNVAVATGASIACQRFNVAALT